MLLPASGTQSERRATSLPDKVASTLAEGFVVGLRSLPANPYDGHTLGEALQQVETLADHRPSLAVVDRGYRGHGVQGMAATIPVGGNKQELSV